MGSILDICPNPRTAPASVPNNMENNEISTLNKKPEANRNGIQVIKASKAFSMVNSPAAWLAMAILAMAGITKYRCRMGDSPASAMLMQKRVAPPETASELVNQSVFLNWMRGSSGHNPVSSFDVPTHSCSSLAHHKHNIDNEASSIVGYNADG